MRYANETLADAEFRRILKDSILPAFKLEGLNAHHSPKAILLVAPAGMPTGRLSSAVYAELRGDTVRVEPDELVAYHPNVRVLQRQSPATWRARIQPVVLAWCEQIISTAMQARTHLIIDTTSTEGSWVTAALVEALQASDYRVELLLEPAARSPRSAKGTEVYDPLTIMLELLQHKSGVKLRVYSQA